jgi:hypothetical protein
LNSRVDKLVSAKREESKEAEFSDNEANLKVSQLDLNKIPSSSKISSLGMQLGQTGRQTHYKTKREIEEENKRCYDSDSSCSDDSSLDDHLTVNLQDEFNERIKNEPSTELTKSQVLLWTDFTSNLTKVRLWYEQFTIMQKVEVWNSIKCRK